MLNSINNTMDYASKLSKDLTGLNINFKHATKKSLKVSTVTNAVAGCSLLALGILTSYKSLLVLGGLGLASSTFMIRELRKTN